MPFAGLRARTKDWLNHRLDEAVLRWLLRGMIAITAAVLVLDYAQRQAQVQEQEETASEASADRLAEALGYHIGIEAHRYGLTLPKLTRDLIEHESMSTHRRQSVAKRHNTMKDDLKFQLRLTLSDEFAQVARNDPGDPSISTLTDILNRHDAVMKCQFDAFAGYVSEAEANGIENFHLYEWTKKTIDDPAKKAKYTKSFALYVGGKEVYEKDKADALEAD